MKHWHRCHKLLSLAVKRHYTTLMMTFIKPDKALSGPNQEVVLLAVWRGSRTAVRRPSLHKNLGAWPPATLNYSTIPQITQMEVSELTVSTMNVLSLQQWPEESKGINVAWDILFQYLSLSLLGLVAAHMSKVSRHFIFAPPSSAPSLWLRHILIL